MKELPAFRLLLGQLQKIPYLASKNLYRVATHILTSSESEVDRLCTVIRDAKQKVGLCKDCFNWVEGTELCAICSGKSREKEKICVVEKWYDLTAIERSGDYRGLYHVLGGVICPLEGVSPDSLYIEQLIKRVERGGVEELIFATNSTPEGEATASYIASKLSANGPTVTRLASGLPMGATLEHMDRVTIYRALSERRLF